MDLEMYGEAVKDLESADKIDRDIGAASTYNSFFSYLKLPQNNLQQLLRQLKLELNNPNRKYYYKILGVSKYANEDDIKKAYHKRALECHPGNKIIL